jgi:hypothetical protein
MEKSGFERHAQTIIGGLILAAIVWGGATLQSISLDVAKLNVEISALKDQIETLQGQTVDRYTKSDATRDFRIRDETLRDIKERLKSLEQR